VLGKKTEDSIENTETAYRVKTTRRAQRRVLDRPKSPIPITSNISGALAYNFGQRKSMGIGDLVTRRADYVAACDIPRHAGT
jgi:hypothetical protein